MLNFLSRRPKLPSSEARRKLEYWLEQFGLHVQQSCRYMSQAMSEDTPSPWDHDFELLDEKLLVDQRVMLGKARLEAEAARECLKEACRTWPEGKTAFRELILGLADFFRMVGNAEEMNSIWRRPGRLDAKLSRIRQLLLRNREHSASGDNRFERGLSRLKDWTGLEIDVDVSEEGSS